MSSFAAPPPSPPIPAPVRDRLELALRELRAGSAVWGGTSPSARADLLDRLLRDTARTAAKWARINAEAEGLDLDAPEGSEIWLKGPYAVLRMLRLLRRALRDIARDGRPRIPGPVRRLPSGQVAVGVVPARWDDQLLYSGVSADVWMEPGLSPEEVVSRQAPAYQDSAPAEVALVLGGGNVSSIAPTDLLEKLFAENRVVALKTHPVNSWLGPVVAEAFAGLVEGGFLRIVEGNADVGAWLCAHPDVAEIHVTGSDRTYEAIVYGPGAEGARRKAERRPLLTKRVTGELGNVSPAVVVPGRWSRADLRFHAESLAGSLVTNAGFLCNATRIIVTAAAWPQREVLLDAMREVLRRIAPRRAWYPGARDRWNRFLESHPEAETYGTPGEDTLPWTFLPGLRPDAQDEIAFSTEAFCSLFGEAAIGGSGVAEFLDRATEFCNERLWGTLNATVLVPPSARSDAQGRAAVERAVERLRYGTVSLNHWAAVSYVLGATPWGAFPGHPPHDIQSGTGFVHNPYMLHPPQKSVLRAAFRTRPKPAWHPLHRSAHVVTRRLTAWEGDRAPARLPGLVWAATRG
jgi:hypothetical protein